MKTTHWISCDYITFRAPEVQSSLKLEGMEPRDAISKAISELDATISRLNRRKAIYGAFLSGETLSDPEAIKL